MKIIYMNCSLRNKNESDFNSNLHYLPVAKIRYQKRFCPVQDLNPWPLLYWFSSLPTELIQRSEVWFLIGTQNFFFVPCSWQDEKTHLSLFIYWAQNLPYLLILSTNITLSTLPILAVCRMHVIIDLAHSGVSVAHWLEHRSTESKGLRFDSS